MWNIFIAGLAAALMRAPAPAPVVQRHAMMRGAASSTELPGVETAALSQGRRTGADRRRSTGLQMLAAKKKGGKGKPPAPRPAAAAPVVATAVPVVAVPVAPPAVPVTPVAATPVPAVPVTPSPATAVPVVAAVPAAAAAVQAVAVSSVPAGMAVPVVTASPVAAAAAVAVPLVPIPAPVVATEDAAAAEVAATMAEQEEGEEVTGPVSGGGDTGGEDEEEEDLAMELLDLLDEIPSRGAGASAADISDVLEIVSDLELESPAGA